MTELAQRLKQWERFDEAKDAERTRLAVLSQRPAPNPVWMYQRVKIRRISERHGFLVEGRAVQFGEVVSVAEIVARGLIQQGKAERA